MTRPTSNLLLVGISIAVLNAPRFVAAQERACPRASEGWLYCEARPGLRQEAQPVPVVGSLYYQEEPLPENLSRDGVRIVTPVGTFRYGEREDQLSSGGWLLESDNTVPLYMQKKQVDSKELEAGFYSGGWQAGTPADWVCVWTPAYLMYCADPAKLDHLRLE